MLQVSIIIKALNEERRIAACLEAALAACQGLAAEVILVDSISTDRTVEIASAYPIQIVRFNSAADVSCGAAVELGWRNSRGEFVYVLDADMVLRPDFLQLALIYLAKNPKVAGVGGLILDTQLNTEPDRQRARVASRAVTAISVDELGGGGLYRREAIVQAGYLAHPALAAYEEAELGIRLRAKGWTLIRLPEVAVLHEGHSETNWRMIKRLWMNGRAQSSAILFLSACRKPWLIPVLLKLKHILLIIFLHLIAAAGLYGVTWYFDWQSGVGFWLGFWAAVFLALTIVNNSFNLAVWRVLFWHYLAAGFLVGLRRSVRDPEVFIASIDLKGNSSLL